MPLDHHPCEDAEGAAVSADDALELYAQARARAPVRSVNVEVVSGKFRCRAACGLGFG